jgi:hypothetical protein
MNRATAERCTILCGLLGPPVHGLDVNDGIEDRGETGICADLSNRGWRPGLPSASSSVANAAERDDRMTGAARPATSISPSIALRKWTKLSSGQSGNHAAGVHRRGSWSDAAGAVRPQSSPIRSAFVYGRLATPAVGRRIRGEKKHGS